MWSHKSSQHPGCIGIVQTQAQAQVPQQKDCLPGVFFELVLPFAPLSKYEHPVVIYSGKVGFRYNIENKSEWFKLIKDHLH